MGEMEMIVTWDGVRSDRTLTYTQPEPDVLAVGANEYDFSDTAIVEYDIPEAVRPYCQEAKRVDGVLHLTLIARYSGHEKRMWEPQPSIETTRDYGTEEALEWRE